MTTKVPLSSLVGQTPVRVRLNSGKTHNFTKIYRQTKTLVYCHYGERNEGFFEARTQVEVLPLEPDKSAEPVNAALLSALQELLAANDARLLVSAVSTKRFTKSIDAAREAVRLATQA